MDVKQETYHVGVIVGRFQVPTLHESHWALIDHVNSKHSKLIIILGIAPTLGTRNNPLDFEMRKQMILSDYPYANVLFVKDNVSNEAWSRDVDNIINSITTPNQKTVLYGGRDSFISCYSGRYPTIELEADKVCSGTEIRKTTSVLARDNHHFRAGVIWSVYNQYPKVFTTVDVAIMKNPSLSMNQMETLLARKSNEKLYRFVGGFAEPNSESFEHDAIREVMEETGLEVSRPKYLGSFKIDDWRYRKDVDKIKTMFFVSEYIFGKADANDDIAETRWFKLSELNENCIVSEHRDLFKCLLNYLKG